MAAKAYFGKELFQFFRELRANNSRGWFQANKKRFERDVREPMLDFIADFGPLLHKISPRFTADPRKSGGSMFRIYRDTRFSKDKTPYKTHAAAQFRHVSANDVHSPAYYFHLEPDNVFFGGGLWRPPSQTLSNVRNAIVAKPKLWRAAIEEPDFASTFKREGDKLKRPPRGFDPEHEFVEDLKFKDHVFGFYTDEATALAPSILEHYAEMMARATAFMRFLTEAQGLPFN